MYDDKGNFINKAKGIKSSFISYFDYVKLLGNKNVNTAIKTESIIDWNKGQVKITDRQVTITSNSYTKRVKIFINGKWIHTRPIIIINSIDKHLAVHIKPDIELIKFNKPNIKYSELV